MTWQHPSPSLTPADFVAAKRPARVLVTTMSGKQIMLVRPEVASDSLVAGTFSEEVPRTQPVVLAGVSPSAITVLEADEGGYRRIRVATDDGEAVLVQDAVFRGDSVIGTRSLPPHRHRTGVPLKEIRAIEVRRVNAPATTLATLAGGVMIVYTAAMIAWLAEVN
jgi:hypothetical protein